MATKAYRCEACGEVHRRHFYAEECCQPEVVDVWCCDECGEDHDTEEAADTCCAEVLESTKRCPKCFRHYPIKDLNRTCIEVAGHCQACDPHFSFDQQFQIEDLHFQRHERHERVNA